MADRLKNTLKSILDLYCHGEECTMEEALRDVAKSVLNLHYHNHNGYTLQLALRDALANLRHISDEFGLSFTIALAASATEEVVEEVEQPLRKHTVRPLTTHEKEDLFDIEEAHGAAQIVWYGGQDSDSERVAVLFDDDGIFLSDYRDDSNYRLPNSKSWPTTLKYNFLTSLPVELFNFQEWGFVFDEDS